MTRRERFLRIYSQADWFAHLMLSTCLLAAVNFLDIFVQTMARPTEIRGDGYTITFCYFGPPVPFYPRFFVLIALIVATLNAFKETVFNRFLASVGSAAALTIYLLWWLASYRTFRNYENFAGIQALIHPEVKHLAYLYYGTPLDLGIAISTVVCLVLLVDRLFDGEKKCFPPTQSRTSEFAFKARR